MVRSYHGHPWGLRCKSGPAALCTELHCGVTPCCPCTLGHTWSNVPACLLPLASACVQFNMPKPSSCHTPAASHLLFTCPCTCPPPAFKRSATPSLPSLARADRLDIPQPPPTGILWDHHYSLHQGIAMGHKKEELLSSHKEIPTYYPLLAIGPLFRHCLYIMTATVFSRLTQEQGKPGHSTCTTLPLTIWVSHLPA